MPRGSRQLEYAAEQAVNAGVTGAQYSDYTVEPDNGLGTKWREWPVSCAKGECPAFVGNRQYDSYFGDKENEESGGSWGECTCKYCTGESEEEDLDEQEIEESPFQLKGENPDYTLSVEMPSEVKARGDSENVLEVG